jgi:hypothetical protein
LRSAEGTQAQGAVTTREGALPAQGPPSVPGPAEAVDGTLAAREGTQADLQLVELRAGRTPQETIALAEQVLRAARAPGAQDLAVASAARAILGEAEALLALQLAEDRRAAPVQTGQATPADQAALPAEQKDAGPALRLPGAPDRSAALALAAYRRAYVPQAASAVSRSA